MEHYCGNEEMRERARARISIPLSFDIVFAFIEHLCVISLHREIYFQ